MAVAAILVSACGNFIVGIALLSKRVELLSAAESAADALLAQTAEALKEAGAVSIEDNGRCISFTDRCGKAMLLRSGSSGNICLVLADCPEESSSLTSGAGRFEFDALFCVASAEKAVFGGYEIKGKLVLSFEGQAVKKLDFSLYTAIG